METFAAAYLIVWLALTLYVVRLGVQQRHLAREVEALQDELDDAEDTEQSVPIAA